MHSQRFLPLALAAILSASTFAAIAQPIDPAAAPPAVSPESIDDGGVDRRCLEATGSRVNADPQPATAKDNTESDSPDCTIGNGTVHTRKDIDQSGATTVKEALQRLDPRVF